MRTLLPLILAAVALALLVAACGGGGGGSASGDIFPVAGNSELVVGPNRFAMGLIGADKEPVFEAPGTSLHLTFISPSGAKTEADAGFTWAIQDVNGFWTTDVNFNEAGQWQTETLLVRDGEELSVKPFKINVAAKSNHPNVGDQAPPTENLTLAGETNLRRLTTDPEPERALYEKTVTQALQEGKPLVVTFATPAFCQTRFCGPILDNVKAVRPEFADRVNFIHIEPFQLDDEGQLVPSASGAPLVSQPMGQWRLDTEPWVYVIDAQGKITARFEGAASPEELTEAITQVVA